MILGIEKNADFYIFYIYIQRCNILRTKMIRIFPHFQRVKSVKKNSFSKIDATSDLRDESTLQFTVVLDSLKQYLIFTNFKIDFLVTKSQLQQQL